MRNEYYGHLEVLLNLPDELDYLQLNRDVQCARWLICNQEIGPTGKGRRNDNPLFKPTAQLVGVIFTLCSGDGMFTTCITFRISRAVSLWRLMPR